MQIRTRESITETLKKLFTYCLSFQQVSIQVLVLTNHTSEIISDSTNTAAANSAYQVKLSKHYGALRCLPHSPQTRLLRFIESNAWTNNKQRMSWPVSFTCLSHSKDKLLPKQVYIVYPFRIFIFVRI